MADDTPNRNETKHDELASGSAAQDPPNPPDGPRNSANEQSRFIPYATPEARKNPGYIPVGGRWAIGCLGFIILSILWWTVGVSYFLPRFEKQWTINGLPSWVGFAGWCVMTGGLLALALWMRLRFGYKGYGYGILSVLLILIGFSLLILAICGPGHF